ncbi:MAG: biotin-dependent carboxyltransferase family protein [Pseudomonadota bacterium]|nr:biotin-dependent carboxyltransferase family protein [Pseudomonadota bacterium]
MAVRFTRIDLTAYPVDAGRQGQLHQGFCQSGPLDPYAFSLANLLCGQPSATTIEFIGGLGVEFTAPAVVSITGPAAEITLDNQLQQSWQSIKVNAGQQLVVAPARIGSKHYLAIQGGFEFPRVVGSASMVKREQLGGLHNDGKPLTASDEVSIASVTTEQKLPGMLPGLLIPDYQSSVRVGLVPGYQHDWLTSLQWQRLLSSEYTITPQVDRMGYRLNGPAIELPSRALYSEAIALGAMQIPPDGQPIVMMADRQTLGGYPKAGTIARCDLNHFAQGIPGDKITFYQLDANDARARWLLQQAAIQRWLSSQVCGPGVFSTRFS